MCIARKVRMPASWYSAYQSCKQAAAYGQQQQWVTAFGMFRVLLLLLALDEL
jgi:hypothetical protein